MPFPIEEKLVVAVASSALFQLDEADAVFRTEGVRAYRSYQREHEREILSPGIAFPFVRRHGPPVGRRNAFQFDAVHFGLSLLR